MNHRESPHLPAGLRRALHCLSLLLVPALTLDEGHAGTRLGNFGRPSGDQVPYLPVLGSRALRIAEAPPPPDLVTRPPAAAPPVPALTPTENSVAAANADAARSTATPIDDPNSSATPPSSNAPAAAAPKTPAPILPDTTRPVIHPEDFLPYFQIPGAVAPAPAPGQLPPSSATYTQSPK